MTAEIRYTTALSHKSGKCLYEDYGDGAKLDPADERIKVVVVS